MRGFTLIEAIIYIALLGLIMTGAVATAYQLLSGAGSLATKNTAGEEGNFVLRKLDWALTGTSTLARITSPALGAYAGTLSLTRADGNTINFIRKTSGSAGWIEMNESAGAYASTTTSNVTVTSLQFHYIPASGAGPAGIEASTTINGMVFSTKRYIRK